MREIEFRAFWKKGKRMLSYEHLKEATKGMVDVSNEEIKKRGFRYNKPSPYGLFLPLEDDELVFMQYTGLKDKNGTKIFEGDIVNMLNITDYPMQIKWNKKWARFIFYNLVDKTEMNLFTEQCEVIGNIYDNPELIKE